MNYKKIYDNLIIKSKQRCLIGYKEKHHIIPKCLGGSNKKSNIAELTPEEHYVAHQLLVKIYPEHKGLKYALYMMTKSPNGRRNNNRLYSWIKTDYFNNRAISSGSTGKKHKPETIALMKEKRKLQIITEETKLKISKTKKGIKMSDEAKASMNEKRKNHSTWGSKSPIPRGTKLIKHECPHCLKLVGNKRYHFDNCKFKGS